MEQSIPMMELLLLGLGGGTERRLQLRHWGFRNIDSAFLSSRKSSALNTMASHKPPPAGSLASPGDHSV
ncbi:hypothetical protein EJB05_33499 [Eragrostis curvula]|uniref:Uncharacterized protein n=1 Tax=Eragrostis curvula TaxID=38414 RepID=A0A5J9U324_9POAL|nr:hypothetical protein EJB05_33499 [Eragrostis curvula]